MAKAIDPSPIDRETWIEMAKETLKSCVETINSPYNI
ncbi:hypothetical protein FACI_IFERC00001G0134 [Ferroplasma acidarmanus Fer1]|jgi:hypothetical protein|uniref:Uncharacterized protein n=1 Tax=Ferroplasma acidarmanus Fer1 TaxID=333146 RepID=S0API6_FERAC|nr:hypothetical protein FACI_IFERC00001G0134 [Ferroplasma acidarmanus Fer1]